MQKKQNIDPNRSTRTSSNHLVDRKLHNSSLNTISSTQPFPQQKNGNKQNKNSRILAEMRQSKNLNTRRQEGTRTNQSTTRSNYKPKFILKQLMQENSHQNDSRDVREQGSLMSSQQSEKQNESMCDDYFMQEKRDMSNTFNNSPLASESCYRFSNKQVRQFNSKDNINSKSTIVDDKNNRKSNMVSKRSHIEADESQFNVIENDSHLKSLNMPVRMMNDQNKKEKKRDFKKRTEQDETSSAQECYQEASTVEYPRQLFSKKLVKGEDEECYDFQSRIRSISSTNPCRQNSSTSMTRQPNYKTSYLEAKKQLEIRTAYFNEAIELCKHIMGNMKLALEEEYAENNSERVMWCHERCEDVLEAFEEWGE